MAMPGVRPSAMAPDVPASMQAAIAVPAVMATAMSMRVPMAAPDLEQIGSSLDMFGSGRGRACRAGGSKGKGRDSGPGEQTYFHGSSFGLIAADNGVEPIWFQSPREAATGDLQTEKGPSKRTANECDPKSADQQMEKALGIISKTLYSFVFIGEWCNGSTTDSDSVCLGSNPGSPATLQIAINILI